MLAYLSRYTHRVAISNSRLVAADASGVTFSYKDYRIEGPGRYNTMTLKPDDIAAIRPELPAFLVVLGRQRKLVALFGQARQLLMGTEIIRRER